MPPQTPHGSCTLASRQGPITGQIAQIASGGASVAESDGVAACAALPALDDDTATGVELRIKYEGYVRKEEASVHRSLRMEESHIPSEITYAELRGLRVEARQQLQRVQPRTVGQASRIPGVTPADVSLLLIHIERMRRAGRGA